MKYTVYIIRCGDNYLYTGLTSNLTKRIRQHKLGLSKPTKNRGMVKLVYRETLDSKYKAAKREKEIKGWGRKKKERLITACSEE